jgi:hypothetical protein
MEAEVAGWFTCVSINLGFLVPVSQESFCSAVIVCTSHSSTSPEHSDPPEADRIQCRLSIQSTKEPASTLPLSGSLFPVSHPPIFRFQDSKILKRWNPNPDARPSETPGLGPGPSKLFGPTLSPSDSRKLLLGNPSPRGLSYSTRLARAQTDSQIAAKVLPSLDLKGALPDLTEGGEEEPGVEKSPSRFPRKGWSDSVVWTGNVPDINFSPSFNKVRGRHGRVTSLGKEAMHLEWKRDKGLFFAPFTLEAVVLTLGMALFVSLVNMLRGRCCCRGARGDES